MCPAHNGTMPTKFEFSEKKAVAYRSKSLDHLSGTVCLTKYNPPKK